VNRFLVEKGLMVYKPNPAPASRIIFLKVSENDPQPVS
jgi:hypothetical protein